MASGAGRGACRTLRSMVDDAADPRGRGARALLIDLDGVLRRWDRRRDVPLEVPFGLPPGTVSRTAFDPPLLEAATTGRITDEEWRRRIVERLVPRYGRDAAAGAVAAWSAPLGRIEASVLELVRAVRRKAPAAPVCLVSNATTRLERDLEALGLRSELDFVINSSRVGARKPDPRIFAAALDAVGAPAAAVLFFDDTLPIVEAARALGLSAHHFTGTAALEGALRGAGLLPAGEDGVPGHLGGQEPQG
jgi:putative hydrolase of the HAD superfamily